MREIKFKGWNTKEKTTGEPFTLQTAIGSRKADGVNTDDVIYMQFTGLKDKNGKEIYEGDILHHKGINYEVGWLEYKWTIRKATGQSHPFRQIYNWPINFEIIGNIYENSELLK